MFHSFIMFDYYTTKCVFIIWSNMLKWKTAAQLHTHTHTHTHIYIYIYIYIYDLQTHSETNLIFFLHTVKWFQILLYNSHNFISVICLHTVYFIWPIDRTLSGATTLGQIRQGSNGNERVLDIPQNSKAEALPSDCLIWYPGHLL